MKKHSTKYKNSVFCLLFNDPDKLRNLYNALTGSSFTKETPVTVTTLYNTLSEGIHNDISFTIGGKTIVFVEHQSTRNPNMPVRLLLYLAAVYEKLILHKNLYSSKMIKIPRPEFYLFYNGNAAFPEYSILKLSDSFMEDSETAKPCLELEVKAYNINTGRNEGLLGKNRDLGEYAEFVATVRKKQIGKESKEEKEKAFRLAIKECIEHNILKEFLKRYGEEVMNSLLSISLEEFIQIRTEEGIAEGLEKRLAEGMAEEKLKTAQKLKAMSLTSMQIAEVAGLSLEKIEKL